MKRIVGMNYQKSNNTRCGSKGKAEFKNEMKKKDNPTSKRTFFPLQGK